MDLPDETEDLDLTLRHVSRQFPEQLARALLPAGAVITAATWADTQVTSRQRRLDRALDVTLVLLSGRDKPWPAHGEYRTGRDGDPFSGVSYRIDAVYQRTVAELAARGSPLWMVFAPLAVDADPEGMTEVVARLRAETSQRDFAELAAALTVVAAKDKRQRGLREGIISLLSEEDVMQSSVFQMGKQHGEQLGKELEERRSIALLYEKRLGRPLEDAERAALIQRLGALGYARLVDVRDELSADALAGWLRNPEAA
jgi:hypothetical protein